MHRCGSGFLLTLAIAFVIAFTGCLGKSSSNQGNGGVASLTLSPSSNLSLDVGGTQVFSASAKDALGHAVLGVDIQFVVGVPQGTTGPAAISINSGGNACAGTWDQTGTMCTPGNSGVATVTAVASGARSTPATVYVHRHIDSVQISRLDPQGPPPYDCFSQGQVWGYQAIAYDSNNVDITSTVGPVNWSSSNAGVVTPTPTVNPQQPNVLNQVQTTARAPGITNLFASVSGTTSSPFPYTTCLIQAIHLQIGGQTQAGNSITLNNGGSVSITATAVDTLYHKAIADNTGLTSPPLTWSTTNPEVIAFSNTTNTSGSNSATARANLGGATITASCTPPTCNIGVLPALPIYASDGPLPNGSMGYGAISVNVTSTSKPPTYTAWAATTGCQNTTGCSSAMFAVTPGATPIGTTISLPRTPNSMMFNHQSSSRVYLGSNQGLMYVDVAANPSVAEVSNLSTPCNVSLCGQVLTISNDGKLVVVSDTVSTLSQVYIYNGGSSTTAPVDLIFDNPAFPGETAIAAAFSPDQLKLFILTQFQAPPPAPAGTYLGNMYVYSTVDALTRIPSPVPPASGPTFTTPANAVTPSADGSFAYVALQPVPTVPPAPPVPGFVSGFANCDTPASEVLSGVSIANPLALYPLPTQQLDLIGNPTEVVLALDPPNIDTFGVNVVQSPLADGQFVCTPPLVGLDTNFPRTSINLGQGSFTPVYTQLVADGAAMIIVARRIPAVLVFNVSNGTTSSVSLVGNADPLSASASTDGSQVYIAACDQYTGTPPEQTCTSGSVHIVNTCAVLSCNVPPTLGQGDFQQVPYFNTNDNNNPSMCNSQGTSAPLCLPNLIAIKPQ